MTADVVAGTVLLPVAALSLREVKSPRELPFALLPTIFSLHQFIEAAVWAGQDGDRSVGFVHLAVLAYVLIAFALLPTYVPLAVLLLEPTGARLRVAPFVVLGAIVSAYLAFAVLSHPVVVHRLPHALSYHTGVENGALWVVLYIVAVIGPALMSGYRSIVAFGLLNLIGLTVVAVLAIRGFASLWCIYAAAASFLVLLHMWRRRRLPDPHRYHGVADPATGTH
ncbi:MAG TPA: DUF6629 family protein [Mycobacterium sp.]|nr:DUF6629 family protein [Mycobacterium sp.]